VLFPAFDRSQWHLASEAYHPGDARHAMGFHFRRYERITPAAHLADKP
jgi:hypothetical protein